VPGGNAGHLFVDNECFQGQHMKARIQITLKNGVLDPQGKAIEGALSGLGFDGVGEVRQGKLIEITLDETDEAKAREQLDQMCENLLANTVIENYSYELV
jgi:phosphoribosylformylglycinamidine synthase subunit PurS